MDVNVALPYWLKAQVVMRMECVMRSVARKAEDMRPVYQCVTSPSGRGFSAIRTGRDCSMERTKKCTSEY